MGRTKQAEDGLVGTWWRCEDHGLIQEPIWIAGGTHSIAYCPEGDCVLQVELVRGAGRDLSSPGAETWRKSDIAVSRRRP